MKQFYFAHPFESRKNLKYMQKKIEKELGVELVNPFYDGPEAKLIEEVDRTGQDCHEYESRTNPKFIVEKDLREIRKSDGVIAVFDKHFSVGTHMEVCYATLIGLPVYSVVLNGYEKHPFIIYFSSVVFTDFVKLADFLKNLKED